MKPKEQKPEMVYRVIDRANQMAVGAFSRAYCNEYDFESVEGARNANCHGTFRDNEKYKVAKYKVTYELIEDDVPGHTDKKQTDPLTLMIIDDIVNTFSL